MTGFPKRGDVYLVNFDPTIGHEVKKLRPALVITNDINNEYSPVVTVIPLSSNVNRVYPFEVRVGVGEGLEKESKIMINQIRTVDKKRLSKKLATMPLQIMKAVEAAIQLHFDMNSG